MKYSISPDRTKLTLTVDADEQAELRAMPEYGERNIHLDTTLADFLEPITCNSELDWIPEGDTGDLTSAPMLGIRDYDAPMTPGPGSGVPVLERWAFMDYQVVSLLQTLRDHGEAVLIGGAL